MPSRGFPSTAADARLFVSTPSPEHFHELRVRIPTDVHRQLLALKILRGVTLAETVVIALDRYFAQRGIAPPNELGAPAKSP